MRMKLTGILSVFGVVAALSAAGLILRSCGVYSFTGTSIQPDVKTVTIPYVEYKALRVNPSLSNVSRNASGILLEDKFRKLTKLEQVDEEGDLEIRGEIIGYDVKAMGITANEVAAQNRLTINVKIYFTNRKYPEEDFEKSFSSYADFDSALTLDAVEAEKCDEIIEKLVEDIFNATVANW